MGRDTVAENGLSIARSQLRGQKRFDLSKRSEMEGGQETVTRPRAS